MSGYEILSLVIIAVGFPLVYMLGFILGIKWERKRVDKAIRDALVEVMQAVGEDEE